MVISKKDNQHYGKYFEQAIDCIVNNLEIKNNTTKNFTEDEIKTMNSDANSFVEKIKPKTSIHIGEETSNQNGDLILDDEIVEIKYVASGKGTYFNTSVKYFEKIGLPSFQEHLKKEGYINFLYNAFPDLVDKENHSPVSQSNSSFIRKEHKVFFEKEIKPREALARKKYVKELYEIIKKDRNLQIQIANDMISKETSNKKIADRLIVFNHVTKEILDIRKKEIENHKKSQEFKLLKNYTFGFDSFNLTIAWQNGTGLNNPTIRIFLK